VAAVPPPFRPGKPALCGSHLLVTPYYCRLGDLLFFVVCVWLLCFSVICVLYVPSVLWYCWLGLLTCKNRLPYDLYCVGGDVKHCSIQFNQSIPSSICRHRWSRASILSTSLLVTAQNSEPYRKKGRMQVLYCITLPKILTAVHTAYLMSEQTYAFPVW